MSNHINDLLVAQDGALWAVTGGAGVRRKEGPQGVETVFHSRAVGQNEISATLHKLH